ncbi:MAG: S49 family peptidase [Henriciella sp.]|nr:S49 family peptidase [Henriciella sp.]
MLPSFLRAGLATLTERPLLLTPAAAEQLANLVGEVRGGPGETKKRTRFANAEPRTEAVAYAPLWMGDSDEVLDWGMTLKDGVAILNIDSSLYPEGWGSGDWWWHGYDTIEAALTLAFADPRVRAVFITMQSPGGLVSEGLWTIAKLIRDNRAQAGGKPVHVHCRYCASAAYWIGSQADWITAGPDAAIGSIGAVILHFDESAAMERWGYKVTPIQFGARKTEFASFKPLDDEAVTNLQAMVDQSGRQFVEAVELGRPMMTAQTSLATEARIFDADHDDPAHSALAIGLIDEVTTEREAFADLVAMVAD